MVAEPAVSKLKLHQALIGLASKAGVTACLWQKVRWVSPAWAAAGRPRRWPASGVTMLAVNDVFVTLLSVSLVCAGRRAARLLCGRGAP